MSSIAPESPESNLYPGSSGVSGHASASPARMPEQIALDAPSLSHSCAGPVLIPSAYANDAVYQDIEPVAESIVQSSNRARDGCYELLKRTLDVLVSAAALATLSPLLLVTALTIKLTSSGPTLFRQRRLGRNGREFWCYKFRSMVAEADKLLQERPDLRSFFEAKYKIDQDPRVTRFGRLLRDTSMDELPQFWNVLRGDMTLIGPRPVVPPELYKYGPHASTLLRVTPGLSGLWQACGRSTTSYEQRIKMDMLYIDNRSIWLDLKLLIATVPAVIRKSGAC